MDRISSSRIARSARRRRLAGALSGVGLGVVAGLVALTITTGGALGTASATPKADPAALIDAAHVPPLLRPAGAQAELRYDVFCPAPDEDPDSGAPCAAGGTVFVRAGESGPFRALRLRHEPAGPEGRYVARVPADIASSPSGFSYYAVVRNEATGATLTLPSGGAAAPHTSLPLGAAVTVDLGQHVFGHARWPDERVFAARWGRSAGEVGLEGGRQTTPIGPSAFDVDGAGRVTVLDQVNRRLLRVPRGGGVASAVPLAISGALADMSTEPDGTVHVLESNATDRQPVLRSFGPDGRAKASVRLAERTAAQVRVGPRGPVTKQYPAEQWMPVADGTEALSSSDQSRRGRTGRPLPDGREVIVLREGDEVRLALVSASGPRRSWRLRSDTSIAEVQLAEPLGNRLVVVLRVYTETEDEFVALVLGPHGAEERFALASADWAETAPLTRFRLAGSSLYQLGSTPDGAHVDRFDLEVTR